MTNTFLIMELSSGLESKVLLKTIDPKLQFSSLRPNCANYCQMCLSHKFSLKTYFSRKTISEIDKYASTLGSTQ